MLIQQIKKFYDPDRLNKIDKDFLEFEEEKILELDQKIILTLLNENRKVDNPYNSIILYITKLSDQFDFNKARADTKGGAFADIDVDYDALERHKIINWCIEYFGREHVANIITHGTLKPKSLARRFYKITEKPASELNAILKKIPNAHHGKEATWEQVVKANPTLKTAKYKDFYNTASKLENLISNFGVHAAGLIISDEPIWDTIPLWAKDETQLNDKGKKEKIQQWITQYDKDECEELGKIKFDFLSIDNLSIAKQCIRLVEQEQSIKLNMYSIEDYDPKTYALIHAGLLCGMFQMETSGSAKKLITDIKPQSIGEISDVSSINRPGPLQANFDTLYLQNKQQGSKPDIMPDPVADILKDSHYVILYQEQIIFMMQKLAGFSLVDADSVRRALGKKKPEILKKWRKRFIDGCENLGIITTEYAEELWLLLAGDPNDENNNGFADYCLAGNTKIHTNQGLQPIADIVEYKLHFDALSLNKDNLIYSQPIEQFHNKGYKKAFTYTFEDGSEITCTPDHKFLTEEAGMISIDSILENNLTLIKGTI